MSKAFINKKKLNRILNAVDDFGADPTGLTDSTAALTAFFQAALDKGGDHSIPKGTYRVLSTINIFRTAPQRHDGVRIKGSGINETTIDFRGSGPILDIRGIPASNGSGTQTGTYFIWGMELSNMTLDGSNKTGTTDGMRVIGLWNSDFKNMNFRNIRNGILSDGDSTYNANPDWSSTANCTLTNCNFERLTGWGFFNSITQAASGWTFNHNLFVLCGAGGILMSSGGVRIVECGFSACGWATEAATPTINGTGIRFGGGVTAVTQNCVENCEFDNNFTSHVDLEYAGGVRFSGNRYIFNDRYGYGSVCPTNGAVRFAPNDPGNAVQNITFSNEVFRLDPGPTTGTPICFNFVNNANVQNILATNAAFADNNASLSFTKVLGHTTSNFWIRNDYKFEVDDISDVNNIIPGRPYTEFAGAISGTPSTAGGNVLTTLKFNLQDSVNNQIFGTSLYDSATGVFTCPVPGYYEVDFVVALVASPTTDYNAFRLYKSGAFIQEWGGAGQGGARTWYQGRRRIFCNAGETLEVREVCAVSRVITGAYSYLNIRLGR